MKTYEIQLTQKQVDLIVSIFGRVSGCSLKSLRRDTDEVMDMLDVRSSLDGIEYVESRMDGDSEITFCIVEDIPESWRD